MKFRLLLGHASAQVWPDLFMPGVYGRDEAEARRQEILAAQPGAVVWVLPEGTDPRSVLDGEVRVGDTNRDSGRALF